MFENVHSMVGLIELTNCPGAAMSQVDDSSLDRLLASFAEHESLADEHCGPASEAKLPAWQSSRDAALYDRRISITADLGALLTDLEREYAELSSTIQ